MILLNGAHKPFWLKMKNSCFHWLQLEALGPSKPRKTNDGATVASFDPLPADAFVGPARAGKATGKCSSMSRIRSNEEQGRFCPGS